MSALHRGDERMHYCDGSHRWIAPPDVEQRAWETGLRVHLEQHRGTMGGSGTAGSAQTEVPISPTPVPSVVKQRDRRAA